MPNDLPLEPWLAKPQPGTKTGPSEIEPWLNAQPAPTRPIVLNQMHQDLSASDRFIVKNFANNPQTAIGYLQKRHPNLEFSMSGSEILAKGQKDKNWKKLDPGGLPTSLSELAMDISDIGYDVAAGVGEGLLTAGAGVAGAAAGGLGAIPAAMATGAVAGAGSEALRQKIGQWAGIQQEIDPGAIKTAALFGGVTPGIFGTGAGAKLAGKFGRDVATQRGVAGRAFDKAGETILPRVASMMSGASVSSIKTLTKKLPKIIRYEAQGISDDVDSIAANLAEKFRKIERNEWGKFEKSIEGPELAIDIGQARGVFDNLYNMAKKQYETLKNAESKAFLRKVNKARRSIFPKDQKVKTEFLELTGEPAYKMVPAPTEFTAKEALNLNRQLSDLAEFGKINPGANDIVNRFGNKLPWAQQQIANAASEAHRTIKDQIERLAAEKGGDVAKRNYIDAINTRKVLNRYLGTPDKLYATMRNANKPSKQLVLETLARVDKKYNTNLVGDAQFLEAFATFGKPSLTPLSAGGTTSTTRSVPMAALMGGLGFWAGAASPLGVGGASLGALGGSLLGNYMGSPAAIRRYVQMRQAAGRGLSNLRDIGIGPVNIPFTAYPLSIQKMQEEQRGF